MEKKHVFHSHLSPEQLLQVIRSCAFELQDVWRFMYIQLAINNFLYRINKNEFQIIRQTFISYPLKPFFYGTVSPERNGSRIEGHFDIPLAIKLFLGTWMTCFVGFFLFVFGMIGNSVRQGKDGIEIFIPAILACLFFMAIFVGMLYISLRLRRSDEKAIIEFIESVCETTNSQVTTAHTPLSDSNYLSYLKTNTLIKYPSYMLPGIGALIAWQVSGSMDIGVYIIVATLLAAVIYYMKYKK